ncbi:MAG TPA: ATP-binding protein, partial [Cyclobacteriaceae bacterium]|nr:ATP-binding protein [Cyclobacteriaceae bacterium]
MSVDDRFVGREKQREIFKQLLVDPYGGDRLMSIWGKGGIGKTWLIKAMLEDAKLATTKKGQSYLVPDLIDMFSTEHRHIEGAMTAIAHRLEIGAKGLFSKHFHSYQEAQIHLESLRKQPEYSQEGIEAQLQAVQNRFREGLSEFVKHQPTVLAIDTIEVVRDTPVKQWLDGLTDGESAPGLVCIVAGRPRQDQSTAIFSSLPNLTDDEALALYTQYMKSAASGFELTEKHKAWIQIVNEKSLGNPLLVALTIFWIEVEELDLSLKDLQDLTPNEFKKKVIHYLSPDNPYTGRPLLSLSKERRFNQPLRQTLVCAAYLNRRFNQQILKKLIENGYVLAKQDDELWSVIEQQLPDS